MEALISKFESIKYCDYTEESIYAADMAWHKCTGKSSDLIFPIIIYIKYCDLTRGVKYLNSYKILERIHL